MLHSNIQSHLVPMYSSHSSYQLILDVGKPRITQRKSRQKLYTNRNWAQDGTEDPGAVMQKCYLLHHHATVCCQSKNKSSTAHASMYTGSEVYTFRTTQVFNFRVLGVYFLWCLNMLITQTLSASASWLLSGATSFFLHSRPFFSGIM